MLRVRAAQLLTVAALVALCLLVAGCGGKKADVTLHSKLSHKKVCVSNCNGSGASTWAVIWYLTILNQNNQTIASQTYRSQTAANQDEQDAEDAAASSEEDEGLSVDEEQASSSDDGSISDDGSADDENDVGQDDDDFSDDSSFSDDG